MIEAPSNIAELGPAKGTIQRALLSVFDKSGVVEFAKALHEEGVELLSSGGTASAIAKAGIPVTPVEVFTGANEVLGGRVKTLHPKIHAGILADRRIDAHIADLEKHNYAPIDLVVCNLYPFEKALADNSPRHVMVENIDIGGPTLLRAAAKNADGGVTVVVDPSDYDAVLSALRESKGVPVETRQNLSAKVFAEVARYDALIAQWATNNTASTTSDVLPETLSSATIENVLRYGENPHQAAALYKLNDEPKGAAHGEVLTGKALSYNNFLDMDAAYRAAYGLDGVGCAIVKHTNPCGLASASTQAEAFKRALAGDPISAFGGIIGLKQPLEAATAQAIIDAKLFVECIAAPEFTDEARELLAKRSNLRLFKFPEGNPEPQLHQHRIGGGVLVQQADPGVVDTADWKVVTKTQLQEGWLEELKFAMYATATLKSNAIAITRGQQLRGAGAGQMSRVDACEQAIKKCGDDSAGSFLGSDAFFPFDDCVRLAGKAGVVAVVQPGGSKRDNEVIAACDELGIAMVFTGKRHFRH